MVGLFTGEIYCLMVRWHVRTRNTDAWVMSGWSAALLYRKLFLGDSSFLSMILDHVLYGTGMLYNL